MFTCDVIDKVEAVDVQGAGLSLGRVWTLSLCFRQPQHVRRPLPPVVPIARLQIKSDTNSSVKVRALKKSYIHL